ncbi:hypothetical protein HY950_03435 [Candidatus Gottesmanbacteria bacterium]|nr:hypothetical protein [Candidatus Gottesmanbacteria bacterium]
MISYLFVFGRTPHLALAELASLFPDVTHFTAGMGILEVSQDDCFSAESVIASLGGTVKIAEVLEDVPKLSGAALAAALAKTADVSKRIVFGISSYHPSISVTVGLLTEVKQVLESMGYTARFVAGRDKEPLTSVVVSKQKLTELIIVPKKQSIVLAKTVAVQDFESWNRRDYGRPYADPKSGMLPPKVARMAVNIGMLNDKCQMLNEKSTLLDPFCGMGTILAEAVLSGWNVVGSDQSKEVVDKARRNLEWLTGSRPIKNQDGIRQGETLSSWKLFISDATHVSEHLLKESIDAIVTEPFMGSTRLGGNNPIRPITQSDQLKTIKNIIKGLEKLYLGCLKDWHKVLKPGGRLVMTLPAFQIGERTMFVKRVIDSCENLGYTKLLGPLEYSRPQAVVKREFYVWHT